MFNRYIFVNPLTLCILQEDVLGFTRSDIQHQEGIVDSFSEHQKPHCLSELHSIQLLYDTTCSQRTSSVIDDVHSTSAAVKSQPSQPHSLSKKSVKASFVKRHYQTSFTKRKLHKYKHETTKSSGKSRLSYFLNMMEICEICSLMQCTISAVCYIL